MGGWVDASLAPEWLKGLHSNSAFKSLSIPNSVLGESDHSSSKYGVLKIGPKTQNGNYSENGSDLD
jgi:hypothetical protein